MVLDWIIFVVQKLSLIHAHWGLCNLFCLWTNMGTWHWTITTALVCNCGI